ncbi:MAG: helix-hairpin-helix domain-containing protein [Bacteroidales bacterium]
MGRERRISAREASAALALLVAIVLVQSLVMLTSDKKDVEYGQTAAGPDVDSMTGRDGFPGESVDKPNVSEAQPMSGSQRTMEQRKQSRVETLFKFNPNLVTKEQLQSLGLSANQAQVVLNYREKGGVFTTKEDFRKIYSLPDGFYEKVKDSMILPDMKAKRGAQVHFEPLELNGADSLQLLDIPGIGPYYASKILALRERLGGLAYVGQLLEMEGMDSARLAPIEPFLTVDTTKIEKKDLNKATFQELSSNPYIGAYIARSIVNLRQRLPDMRVDIAVLALHQIVSESILAKLRYYFE